MRVLDAFNLRAQFMVRRSDVTVVRVTWTKGRAKPFTISFSDASSVHLASATIYNFRRFRSTLANALGITVRSSDYIISGWEERTGALLIDAAEHLGVDGGQ